MKKKTQNETKESEVNEMMKKRQNRGITLIALVVTIVVLIILATISINAVWGDDGLIKRAEQASQHQANAEASDNDAMGILDKYITDASKVEKEPRLQVVYTNEDAGKGAKIVKLSYSISTGEATAEQIEAKLEEIIGTTISDDEKAGLKAEADSLNLTYEEYLLEVIIQIELEEEITEESRIELKAEAESNGMTYQKYLEYLLEEYLGISFGEPLVSTEDLEQMVVELYYKEHGQEITFDEEMRESLTKTATSNGMTYREYLELMLERNGVDTSGVTTEVELGGTTIASANSEFIATRNGTYTVKTTAKNGMKTETQIEVTGIEEEKFSSIYETTATYTDASGATATIPAGFAVGTSEGINTIADGLVITDAVDEDGYSIGNEFVWIPVESDETFIRESFESTELDTTTYTEPYTSGYSDGNGTQETAEYNTMRTQVLKYNGFYIGRYEAGTTSSTLRTGETEAQQVVIKRGVVPYNYVTWGESMSDIGTNGAVYLSQNMYADSSSVTSTLCYGVQWDAMCRYIEDYTRTTSAKTGVDLTGRIEEDVSKNIYDLAGNCWEWTMETGNGQNRVLRGGYFFYYDPIAISFRIAGPWEGYWEDLDEGTSFRCTLYIK